MTVLVYSQLSAQKFFINCINLQLCQGGWGEEKVVPVWGRWGLNSSSYSRLHGKGKRACWFFRWLFSSQDPMGSGGMGMGNTCRKEILLRRPLSGILFFMIWFAFFFFSVPFCLLHSLCCDVLQMKSKMLLIVYWITANVAAHPIQCEIMLTTWLNSSAVPPFHPLPSPTRVNVYICIYVMKLDLFRVASCRFA